MTEFNSYMILLGVYAVLNFFAFFMYGIDKHKAKRGSRRISESALTTAAIFGAIGALLGMLFFRHKTKKPRFYIGIPVIIIIEAAIFLLVCNIFVKDCGVLIDDADVGRLICIRN